MNKLQLIGYLGQDPKICNHKKRGKIANLSLATAVSWQTNIREGRKHRNWQKQDWHHITVSKESIIGWLQEESIKKGHLLYIQGSLTYKEGGECSPSKKRTPHVVVSERFGKILRIYPNDEQNNVQNSVQKHLKLPNLLLIGETK